MSPQADYVVSNGTGAAVRSDINGQLAAIVSNNSGASAPATTYAYMLWADTSTNLLKLRNGANSAWITVGDLTAANLGLATLASPTFTGTATIPTLTVSTAANIPLGSAASPTLYFTGDSNTGLYSPGADQVALSTGGTGRLFINSSGSVGIGTSSPQSRLDLGPQQSNTTPSRTATKYQLVMSTGDTTSEYSHNIGFYLAGNNNVTAAIDTVENGGDGATGLVFATSSSTAVDPSERLRITADGKVGIGTTSPATILHLSASSPRFRLEDSDGGYAHIEADGGNLFLVSDNGASQANSFLALGVDGTERARIDSSGRWLLGTSSARANFDNSTNTAISQIETADSTAKLSIIRNNGTPGLLLASSAGSTVGSNTIVTSGWNVGQIAFAGSDGSEFVNLATIDGVVDGTPGANDMPGRLVFSVTADGASSPTERMRIGSTGSLLCGRDFRDATNGTDDQFIIGGNGYSAFHGLNTTAYTIGQNSNSRALRIGSGSGWATSGVSLAAGGTSWGTYSDERLKTDIVELTGCLESIKGIRCVSYRLTDLDEADSKKRLGVIAQDLVGKYDEAITASQRAPEDEIEYLSVQYTDLIPVLLKALQEATTEIETLKTKVAALESA